MNSLNSLELENKNIVLRVDLNVPIQDGKILDRTRIDAVRPTIDFLLSQDSRILLISHLGRPIEGNLESKYSLRPIKEEFEKIYNTTIDLFNDLEAKEIFQGKGKIQFLENIRSFNGESSNCPKLSNKLGTLGDLYVFDAFGTAHRKQASTYGAIKSALASAPGLLLEKEISSLKSVLDNYKNPYIVVIGGSKVSTKLGLIENLINKVDKIIVGGGIANTFLLAKEYEIGESLCEPDMLNIAERLMNSGKIILPEEVVTSKSFEGDSIRTKKIDKLDKDDLILDLCLSNTMAEIIKNASTILWNGPLGVFENEFFEKGTRDLAVEIEKASAYTVAGGGETLAAISKFINKDGVSYSSTGGGAFLEFMEGKVLPAIEALS